MKDMKFNISYALQLTNGSFLSNFIVYNNMKDLWLSENTFVLEPSKDLAIPHT
jgi:hypothetical protein